VPQSKSKCSPTAAASGGHACRCTAVYTCDRIAPSAARYVARNLVSTLVGFISVIPVWRGDRPNVTGLEGPAAGAAAVAIISEDGTCFAPPILPVLRGSRWIYSRSRSTFMRTRGAKFKANARERSELCPRCFWLAILSLKSSFFRRGTAPAFR